jgi:hypothetical protein
VTLFLPLLGFVFVSLLVIGTALVLSPSPSAVERRLSELAGPATKSDDEASAAW